MFLYYMWFLCGVIVSSFCDGQSVNDLFMDLRQNASDSALSSNKKLETTTYRYPTATWSAHKHVKSKKISEAETGKLFLFKPSPFLKPPFTDGVVGSNIRGIEDGLNVSGHRRSKIWRDDDERNNLKYDKDKFKKNKSAKEDLLDKFLEEALHKYIRSANLTDEFGTISLEMFEEALKKVTASKRRKMPYYSQNEELHRKFKNDLSPPPKKQELPPGGLVEKQYQKRIQKTWDMMKESLSDASISAVFAENSATPRQLPLTTTPMSWTESNRELLDGSETVQYREGGKTWGVLPAPGNNLLLPSQKSNPVESFKGTATEQTINGHYITYPYSTENPSSTIQNVQLSSFAVTEAYKPTLAPIPITLNKPTTASQPFTKLVSLKPLRGTRKYKDTLAKQEVNPDGEEFHLAAAESSYYQSGYRGGLDVASKKEPEFGAIPGVPGVDYPTLSSPVSTGFTCPKLKGQGSVMLADPKTRCQVFYMCTEDSPGTPVLCPNGTMFNENVLVCDWWFNVDC